MGIVSSCWHVMNWFLFPNEIGGYAPSSKKLRRYLFEIIYNLSRLYNSTNFELKICWII
jgi:hypothetical protein